MGGAVIDQIKDFTVTGDMKLSLPQGEIAMKMNVTANVAGKTVSTMQTPMGEITQGYDGQVAWAKTPQGVREAPASQLGEVQGTLFRDTFSLLRNIDNPAYTVQALDTAEVEGKKAEGVAISDAARKLQVKLWIESATGLLVKKTYTAAFMGPPAELEEISSDYRDVSGLQVAHTAALNRDGKRLGVTTITSFKLNPGVPDSAYQKPN
jgi:hypothetical protein